MRQKNTLYGLYLLGNVLKTRTNSDEDKLRVKEFSKLIRQFGEKTAVSRQIFLSLALIHKK